jgi:hypothetical protein
MIDSPDIPLELQRLRAPARGRSGNRRSELERLLDLTVLEPTHPELGSCWRFTGTTTPYGRIARCGVYAGWNPDQLKPVTHAENQSHMRKTHCKHGHPLFGRQSADQPEWGAGMPGVQRGEPERLPGAAAPPEPLAPIPHRIRYVNHPSALASLLIHGSVERHVDVSRNVMLLSVGVDEDVSGTTTSGCQQTDGLRPAGVA